MTSSPASVYYEMPPCKIHQQRATTDMETGRHGCIIRKGGWSDTLSYVLEIPQRFPCTYEFLDLASPRKLGGLHLSLNPLYHPSPQNQDRKKPAGFLSQLPHNHPPYQNSSKPFPR